MEISKRNTALDLIRILAVYLVISIHFFSYIGFYEQTVKGGQLYVAVLTRTFCTTCVPLFLILTGYLMNSKEISKKYYLSISKTLNIYVLVSIIQIMFEKVCYNKDISIKNVTINILNFTATNYAWYIEMYIGLYILIPFLNILYRNISEKKQKKILVVSLLFLTALPGLVNIRLFEINKIIPSWWTNLYPITYYFIGCYICEFNLKIKKRFNILLLIITTIIIGTFNFYMSYDKKFIWGNWCDWASILTVILACLLFVLLLNIDMKSRTEYVKKVLEKLSNLCLGAYMLSAIFDEIFYSKLNMEVADVSDRYKYYFTIVPIIFFCSMGLSYVLNFFYNILLQLIELVVKLSKKIFLG